MASAEEISSAPLICPYRSAVSIVNGMTSETAVSSAALTSWIRFWFAPRSLGAGEDFAESQRPGYKLIVPLSHARPNRIHTLTEQGIFLQPINE